MTSGEVGRSETRSYGTACGRRAGVRIRVPGSRTRGEGPDMTATGSRLVRGSGAKAPTGVLGVTRWVVHTLQYSLRIPSLRPRSEQLRG